MKKAFLVVLLIFSSTTLLVFLGYDFGYILMSQSDIFISTGKILNHSAQLIIGIGLSTLVINITYTNKKLPIILKIILWIVVLVDLSAGGVVIGSDIFIATLY